MLVAPGVFLNVTATELWYANMRAGRCFARATGLGAGGAGNFSKAQLKNPVASGVQCVVRACIAGPVTTTDILNIYRNDTDLASDTGAGINLLIGGPGGASHARFEQTAGHPATQIGTFMTLANTSYQVAPDWLCELSPGQGVEIDMVTANLGLQVMWFWMENPQ